MPYRRTPLEYNIFLSKFGDWVEKNVPIDPRIIEGLEKNPNRARREIQRIFTDKYDDEIRRLKRAGYDDTMARAKAGILKYGAKNWATDPDKTKKYFPTLYEKLIAPVEKTEDDLVKISDFDKEISAAESSGAPAIAKGIRERIKKAKLSSKDEDELFKRSVQLDVKLGKPVREDLATKYLPEDMKEEARELDSFQKEWGDRWYAQPIREMAAAGLSRDSIRKAKVREISEIYKPVWSAPRGVLESYGLKDYEIDDIKKRGKIAERKLEEAGETRFLEGVRERERIARLLGGKV